MNRKDFIFVIGTIVACVMAAGCASGPTLSSLGVKVEDRYPLSDRCANVFICRSQQLFEMRITIDGFPIQRPLEGDSFLAIQVPPGKHLIELQDCTKSDTKFTKLALMETTPGNLVPVGDVICELPNMENLGDDGTKLTQISVEAGQEYFFKTGIGFTAPDDLQELPKAEGRETISHSQLPATASFVVLTGKSFAQAWSALHSGMKPLEVYKLLGISGSGMAEFGNPVTEIFEVGRFDPRRLHFEHGVLQSWEKN